MSTKKYLSYDGLAEYDVLIKSDIDKKVSNKQDKTIVVTKGSDNLASHTPSEILEHSKDGANAVYFDGGTYHAFLEGDASGAIFYSSYIDNSKIQFTIVQIFADKTISYSRSSYNPPVTSVNNKTGKISLTASDVGADSIGSAAQSLKEAKSYADNAATTVKNDLLNGAGEAYDTLKELGDLITENVDAIDALEIVATGKADKEHTHTYESIEGLEDVIKNVADSKFYVVTFDKGEDNKYHGDLTFAEIREKFEAGGNMVARIDGTDYIPLLSAAPHQIIFSGIYQSQSVSLTINSSDVCTLTTTSLTSSNNLHAHTSNYKNPHKVTCEQIGAATVDNLNTLQENLNVLNDELSNSIENISWNDLKDRPFYKETKLEAILSTTVSDFNYGNKFGCYSAQILDTYLGLESGKKYTVIFNGVTYSDLICSINATDEPIIGAYVDRHGSDNNFTNYPFSIVDSTMTNVCMLYLEEEVESTVEILEVVENIVKIDESYMSDTIARTEYVDAQLATKADKNHTHDDRYYTEAEIDKRFLEVSANVDILSDTIGEGYEVISNEELDLLFV